MDINCFNNIGIYKFEVYLVSKFTAALAIRESTVGVVAGDEVI